MASKESEKIKQEEEDNLDESTDVQEEGKTLNKKQRQKIVALKKRADERAAKALLDSQLDPLKVGEEEKKEEFKEEEKKEENKEGSQEHSE